MNKQELTVQKIHQYKKDLAFGDGKVKLCEKCYSGTSKMHHGIWCESCPGKMRWYYNLTWQQLISLNNRTTIEFYFHICTKEGIDVIKNDILDRYNFSTICLDQIAE